MTEPELRELVEKGAKALGAEPMPFSLMFNAAAYQEEARKYEAECTRLRAWLKAIADTPIVTYSWGEQFPSLAKRALAGEEAPRG